MRIAKLFLSSLVLFWTCANGQTCDTGERALLRGATDKKQVLICASPLKPPFQKIEYRFGTQEKVELAFTADKNNGKRFYVGNEALDPRSSANYLWFKNGDTTYLIAECWGANCGLNTNILTVARGKKILAKIKLKENEFLLDGITDFNRSSDPLIQVKPPETLEIYNLF